MADSYSTAIDLYINGQQNLNPRDFVTKKENTNRDTTEDVSSIVDNNNISNVETRRRRPSFRSLTSKFKSKFQIKKTDKLSKSHSQSSNLNQTISDLEDVITNLNEDLALQTNLLTEANTDRQTLNSQYTSLKTQNWELKNSCESLTETIQKLTNKHNEQVKKYEESLIELQNRIKLHLQELEQLSISQQTLEQKTRDGCVCKTGVSIDTDIQHQQINGPTGYEESLVVVTELRHQLKIQKEEIHQLSVTNQKLEQENKDVIVGSVEMQNKMDNLSQKYEESQIELTELKKQVQLQTDEINRLSSSNQKNIDCIVCKIKVKKESISKSQLCEESVVDLRNQMEVQKDEINRLSTTNKKLEQKIIDVMCSKFETKVKRLDDEESMATLHTQVKLQKDEVDKLSNINDTLELLLKDGRISENELKTKMEKQNKEHEESVTELKTQIRLQAVQIQELSATNEMLNQEVEDSQKDERKKDNVRDMGSTMTWKNYSYSIDQSLNTEQTTRFDHIRPLDDKTNILVGTTVMQRVSPWRLDSTGNTEIRTLPGASINDIYDFICRCEASFYTLNFVVLAETNFAGPGLNVSRCEADYIQLILVIRQRFPRAIIKFIGLIPRLSLSYNRSILRINTMLQMLCCDFNCEYISSEPSFLSVSGALKSSLYADDKTLNQKGTAEVARLLLSALRYKSCCMLRH
ncbi:paramyosin [Patella vulgata]|uniref:paramyosin n=1 Tax=Patella vulgata TaxID=6465 RepID=UPI00218003B3|nr:paramyosin [Patella vulgata]